MIVAIAGIWLLGLQSAQADGAARHAAPFCPHGGNELRPCGHKHRGAP